MHSLQFHEVKQRGSIEFPLDFHHVGIKSARYEMPYHWHEETEILYIRSGSFSLSLDRENIELSAGDVVYIAAGSLHAGIPHNCVYDCIVYDLQMMLSAPGLCREKMGDIVSGRYQIQKYYQSGDSLVTCFIVPIFESLYLRKTGMELTTFGLLYAFYGEIISRGAYHVESSLHNHGEKTLQLKAVFELIENNYSRKLTLDLLASAAHMEPKYFCRFFKQSTHMSPMQYLQYYRIERACREIQLTDKNITEIALDSGFSSPEYFARVFRKHKKTTPGEYRDKLRQYRINEVMQ